MHPSLMQRWRAGLFGMVMFAIVGGVAHAAPSTLDPLGRAAPKSARGEQSMLLAVTLAGQRIVAVGERGIVLISDDNGVSWKQAEVPVSVLLTGVRFATPEKGWAVGHSGVVLRTEDGGRSWVKSLDGERAAALQLNAALKEAGVSGDAARRIADAERLVKDGADKPFFDILVDGENGALVVGAYGLAYRTADGGKTWAPWQAQLNNPKGAHLHAISAADASVFVAGEQGLVLVSRDRGQSFSELKSPYTGSFFGVVALSEQSLLLFGLRGKSFWTIDGGANWQASTTGLEASFNGATRLRDGSVLLVSQAGNVLRSTDGGKSFAPVPIKMPVPFVGVTEAADGSLVLVGVRGVTRVVLPAPIATKS